MMSVSTDANTILRFGHRNISIAHNVSISIGGLIMNMRWYIVLLTSFLLFPTINVNAVVSKDRRAVPINIEQFRTEMKKASTLNEKEILLDRAYYSKISEAAYNECVNIWNQNKNNPDAIFIKGLSASLYNSSKDLGAPNTDLWDTAKECFEKAYKLQPKSQQYMLEYGHFIWNYSLDRELGKKLIEKAVYINPKDPQAHLALGYVYVTPNTKYTNYKEAIDEINIALRTDPNYAGAHKALATAYGMQYRVAAAKREMAIAKSLITYP